MVEEGVNALLVEPGDVAGLAAVLGRLLDEPALRHAFGAHGRRRYEQLFTARTMAERIIACTGALFDDPPRASPGAPDDALAEAE